MEEKTLKEKVDELYENNNRKNPKKRKMKPGKAKVSKSKMKKGYVAVMKIHENKNVDFEKVPIEESAYNLKEGTYHSLSGDDVFFYRGRPLIIQPTIKKNPYNPLEGYNETKGQKHIMNLMSKHSIKEGKKLGGNWIIYLLIVAGAIFGIKYLMGGA